MKLIWPLKFLVFQCRNIPLNKYPKKINYSNMSETKKTIAIIGINGSVGKPALEAFISPTFKKFYNLPIRVLTGNPDKVGEYPKNDVKCYKVNYGEGSSYIEGLTGVDVVIDATSLSGDNRPIMDAADKCGVKVYFPPGFGPDYGPVLEEYPNFVVIMEKQSKYAETKSFHSVYLRTGWFADFIVNMPSAFTFTSENNKAYKLGSGNYNVPVTFLSDIGKSFASLARHPANEIPRYVPIRGDVYHQNEILDLYQKIKNVKLDIVERSQEEVIESTQKADAHLKEEVNLQVIMQVVQLFVHPKCTFESHFNNDKIQDFVTDGLFEWKKLVPEATKVWSNQDANPKQYSNWDII